MEDDAAVVRGDHSDRYALEEDLPADGVVAPSGCVVLLVLSKGVAVRDVGDDRPCVDGAVDVLGQGVVQPLDRVVGRDLLAAVDVHRLRWVVGQDVPHSSDRIILGLTNVIATS